MNDSYELIAAQGTAKPILISCPHVGTMIPGDIKKNMDPAVAAATPDTDWFIHELYEFAPQMGITLIKANFSRYVIDLNRDPSGKSLYADNRQQTQLIPTQTFAGKPIYPHHTIDGDEILKRTKLYFDPYHAQIHRKLANLRLKFANTLFFDAHSIKRMVASIRSTPFPDMIIGDNKGATADGGLSAAALKLLREQNWDVSHNDPFMGGFLTRSNGNPKAGVHAIQLEMSQDLYMNENDNSRNPTKTAQVAVSLKLMFETLISVLERMNHDPI